MFLEDAQVFFFFFFFNNVIVFEMVKRAEEISF